MYMDAYIGKEVARMWHSFGRIDKTTVVKYIWQERTAEYDEESGWYYITQEVYKKVSNEPGKRWQRISEKSKCVPGEKQQRFILSLIENHFTADWPKYDEPFLKCAISY